MSSVQLRNRTESQPAELTQLVSNRALRIQGRYSGITKRGNAYLRTLLIHGARAALPGLSRSETPLGAWLRALDERAHPNVVVVALAAKLARIAWAVLRSGDDYGRRTAAA